MTDTIIATNRQARHYYAILETIEAGIELKGPEVKSLRAAQAYLSDGFARIEGTRVILYNVHIAPYAFGNYANVDPLRPRYLLLHKNQIRKLAGAMLAKGTTLVPLKLYFKNGIAKVELALARGKQLHDKRESIKQREAERDLKRALKAHK